MEQPVRSLRIAMDKQKKIRLTSIDRGLKLAARVISQTQAQWESSQQNGVLQHVPAFIKIIFLMVWIVAVSFTHNILHLSIGVCFLFGLCLISKLDWKDWTKKVFLMTFLFGFLVALPATTNVFVDGKLLWTIATLNQSYHWGPYTIPAKIGITGQGLTMLALLCLRIMNSVGVTLIVLSTTAFWKITQALRTLKVPAFFVEILFLTYKMIVIFARTVEDMHLAKKSRQCSSETFAGSQTWVAQGLGVLFKKTERRMQEMQKAMEARGV